MRVRLALGFVASLLVLGTGEGRAADYREFHRHARGVHRAVIGDCVRTRVEAIGPLPGGALAIRYADGVLQDYDGDMLGQSDTRTGDPIRLCLIGFTRDCGSVLPDEQPGRTYATGNLRTGAAWTSPDIRSSCAAR